MTTTGAVAVGLTDATILMQKTGSGASTLNLPPSATRSGLPLTVKDLTRDAATNHERPIRAFPRNVASEKLAYPARGASPGGRAVCR